MKEENNKKTDTIIMTTNKLYMSQMRAARRLFGWVDRHPYLTNAIIAAEGVILALYALFFYPL